MIREDACPLVSDETLSLNIRLGERDAGIRSRFPRGGEAGIGIAFGLHAAVLLCLVLIHSFSSFQAGGMRCVTVSLVAMPENAAGDEHLSPPQQEQRKETRSVDRQAIADNPSPVHETPRKIKKLRSIKKQVGEPPQSQHVSSPEPRPGSATADASEPANNDGNGGNVSGRTAVSGDQSVVSAFSGTGEFLMRQVDQPPVPTQTVEPVFPLAAREKGIGGKVVVKFLVQADGNVAKVSIIDAEPKEIFDQSTLEAVARWRFHPGRYHGEAVATWVVLPVQFRLYR